ncbi:diguanylate cyclase [Leptothermofonsia sichuanensis E412]|uniref:diguanylate cyclase domain-containing protein n=1 Tax=Leptothermofonsia sichuanensis TaxID=2917832 RepID=UPI001CA6FFF8|nr:diguanylate cyclase [Leptothermofonsia sichuanensis]QZZ20881.1 diguanylate cyclase [Leptothermofonsia sichuanensis E412]
MRSSIICVDDEWPILKSLGEQLKRNFGKNYDVELANSGDEAILLCAEISAASHDIPLIISDHRMSGMGGDALLIQLHTLYPKTLKIMLTGQADADSVGNVVNQAALYRYIRKPWDETDLILTVTEALRRFQQEQQLAEQKQQLAEQNKLLKQMNTKLKSSLSLLLAALDATADGILALDNSGKVISFNRKFTHIWGISESDLIIYEENLINFVLHQLTESDAARFQELLKQANIEKHEFLNLKNGCVIEYYLRPQYLEGRAVGRVLSCRDVTQEKQREAVIQHQALHDALTNLPNRTLFSQKLAALLDVGGSQLFAVMFLDLDRFKEVNDTLGHVIGDRLLQDVVQRFTGCLRKEDMLARWGGDEFVLLLSQVNCREDIGEIARRLIKSLQTEFFVEGFRLKVSVSVGIAIYPQDGFHGRELLQNADAALYQAKKEGRNTYRYYKPSPMPEQLD